MVSASRAADGKILVTVANLDAAHPAEAQVLLGGVKAAAVGGTGSLRHRRCPQHLYCARRRAAQGAVRHADRRWLYGRTARLQCSRLYGNTAVSASNQCRRCLLQEMTDENDYYQSVVRYRAALPAKKRTPDAEYATRLACCKACDALNAGTCMQCGCYVEMRAARLDMALPQGGAMVSLCASPEEFCVPM